MVNRSEKWDSEERRRTHYAELYARYRKEAQPLLDSGFAKLISKRLELERRDGRLYGIPYGDGTSLLVLDSEMRGNTQIMYTLPVTEFPYNTILNSFDRYKQKKLNRLLSSVIVGFLIRNYLEINYNDDVRKRIESTYDLIDKQNNTNKM